MSRTYPTDYQRPTIPPSVFTPKGKVIYHQTWDGGSQDWDDTYNNIQAPFIRSGEIALPGRKYSIHALVRGGASRVGEFSLMHCSCYPTKKLYVIEGWFFQPKTLGAITYCMVHWALCLEMANGDNVRQNYEFDVFGDSLRYKNSAGSFPVVVTLPNAPGQGFWHNMYGIIDNAKRQYVEFGFDGIILDISGKAPYETPISGYYMHPYIWTYNSVDRRHLYIGDIILRVI